MPLQIRRGTESQRVDPAINLTLAEGELLWVTNEKKLYIGDGTTLAANLLPVTGFNDEDARDAAASLFTTASHTNISFTYDDNSNTLSAAVNLSNYDGVIKASAFNGSLFADDSSELINAVQGKINLDGTVKGHIIPDTNVTYDLGSATNRFRDLYLSGSSIKLGAATITASGAAVSLPAGSTVDGNPIGDAVNGSTITGNFIGDIKGSVFGDDSTMLVDSTNSELRGRYVTDKLEIFSNFITTKATFNADDPIFFKGIENSFIRVHPGEATLEFRGVLDPLNPSDHDTLQHYVSRGTISSPTSLAAGDQLYADIALGYDGTNFVQASYVGVVVDTRYPPTTGSVRAAHVVSFPDRLAPGDNVFLADTNGVFTSPVALQVTPLANPAARDAALPSGVVAAGMMVFLTDSTGSGGPAKLQVNTDGTTGGWVDLN